MYFSSQPFYELLPEVRKLNEEELSDVLGFMKLGSNHKQLQLMIHEKFKKKITLKDLSNIQRRLQISDELEVAIELLKKQGIFYF